ncbi:MAG: cupin [Firmicutes bacterium]|nr:cupin [Bacillota bacterium]
MPCAIVVASDVISPASPLPTSTIEAVMDWARQLGPAPVIRADLAWPLYLPASCTPEGVTMPRGNPRTTSRGLLDWLRLTLAGMVTAWPNHPFVVLMPRSTEAALELVRRQVSFYETVVGLYTLSPAEDPTCLAEGWNQFVSDHTSPWQDGWMAPAVRPWSHPGPLLTETAKATMGGDFIFLGAALGSDRLAVQTYRLRPGGRGNRRHGHSDVDECYLITDGDGIVRCGSRMFAVQPGTLVAKPAGSRLGLEFIAGPSGLTVWDIEGWRSFSQSDVVFYPDHRKWYLRGPGLEQGCPEPALFPAEELLKAYEQRYVRQADGTLQPDGEIP